uniref:Heparan sulfate proteoglycan 2 n=1 Tax=Chelydra serpentina TaxID=8475 RepID=A0A8C3T706_CHESE
GGGAIPAGGLPSAIPCLLSSQGVMSWFSLLSCALLSRWLSLLSACPVYFRALVNFTKSIDYSPHLIDANSEEFQEVSEAVVDTLESEYYKIGGEQVVSVVFIKEIDGYTFVELDVGSEGNPDEGEIRKVLYSVIESGSIAAYVTSTQGFQFRRLGAVPLDVRACTGEEFACSSGECIEKEFRCDRRPDCRDMSDELHCTNPPAGSSPPLGPLLSPLSILPAKGVTSQPPSWLMLQPQVKSCIPNAAWSRLQPSLWQGSPLFTPRASLLSRAPSEWGGDHSGWFPSRTVETWRPLPSPPVLRPGSGSIPDGTRVGGSTLGLPDLQGECQLSPGISVARDCPTPCVQLFLLPSRCPIGYLGLSCERCDARFERVPEGPYLGTCSGCNCHGHSSSCDRVFGYCLNCQHNTEGPQCNKCKPGFFGDATRGNTTACRACPCPYTDSMRRFSDSCFLDTDGQATCDACAPGYTGRRCQRWVPGALGEQQGSQEFMKCDKRGSSDSTGGACRCKPNVVGHLCNECTSGAFYLSDQNPDGCLKCFCMGVSRQCASSSWNREQAMDGERAHFSLANLANTRTVSEGIRSPSHAELAFSAFHALPRDVYYWVLPDRFKGDKVTSYGGELHYTVMYSAAHGAHPLPGQPDVLLRGNGIFLEHFAEADPLPGTPTRLTVPFRERAWRRADRQDATREHLLMALADIDLFMIRASYMDRPAESRLSNIRMDVAVPHATGLEQAVEVEECTCPPGYRGPSCQDCDVGYARTTSGLYLGTCERCDCSGHSTECDAETGDCQNCQDNTEGTRCERCQPGYYGDAQRGTPADCQPCPCHRPHATSQATKTCFLDTDGQPTCNDCTTGYVGRQCQRYGGCQSVPAQIGNCSCDPQGSVSRQCDASRQCQCKPHVEGPSCSSCRANHFHLSAENRDGCLPCFCMGVTQQCTSSSYYRGLITTPFLPGDFQSFALVNRQHSTRIVTGFAVELSAEGPQLSFGRFGQLGQESYYWQLPEAYQGDKVWQEHGLPAGAQSPARPPAPPWLEHGEGVPQVQVSPAQTEVQEGSTVRLYCRVAGSPTATITWEKQGGSLPPQSRSEHTDIATLVIPSIAAADSGVYLCIGTSPAGVGSARIEVVVLRASGRAPPIQIEASSSSVAEGQTLDLNCLVTVLAPATVMWYKRGGSLVTPWTAVELQRFTPAGVGLWHCRARGWAPSGPRTDAHGSQGGFSFSQGRRAALSFSENRETGGCRNERPTVQAVAQGCFLLFPLEFPPCQVSGSRLRISQISAADSGEYVCRVSIGGSPREASIPVTVQHASGVEPPVLIESSSSSIAEGETLDLNCLVAGQAPATVTWYKRGGSLPASHQVGHTHTGHDCGLLGPRESGSGGVVCCRWAHIWRTSISLQSYLVSGSRLRIPQVSAADSGEYVCRVSTGTVVQEASVIVTISSAGSSYCESSCTHPLLLALPALGVRPTIQIEQSSSSITEGQTLDLNCLVEGQAPATVTWYKRGGSLPADHQLSGSHLRLVQVSAVDSGEYVCRAGNKEASVIVTIQQSSSISYRELCMATVLSSSPGRRKLGALWGCTRQGIQELPASAHPAPALGDLPPQLCSISSPWEGVRACSSNPLPLAPPASGITPPVRIESSSSSIAEGQTLDLNCLVAGQVQPRVTWHKRGGSLPAGHQVSGSRLRIPQVSAADSGEYICRVSNGAGPLEASVIVTIPLSAASGMAPPVRIESSSSSIAEGQTLDLNCLVVGQAQPRVTWYKRGGSLPASHQVSGSRLRIPQVSAADSGEYVCRVSTGAMTQEAALVVTIEDSTGPSYPSGVVPPVRIESSSSSIAEGQTLDLNCLIAGQAPATVTWYKRGGSLPASHQVSDSRLRLVQVSAADSGEYVCRLSTSAGPREASITVSVPSGTSSSYRLQSPIISIEPHSTAVRQGEDATFKCRVHDGARPINITWKMAPKQQLQDNVKISPNGSVITISRARPSNQGAYRCVASNRYGVANSVVNLMVQGSPTVSVMPKGPVTVKAGKSISLDCLGMGDPRPLVRWSRLGMRQKIEHQTLLPLEPHPLPQISAAKPEDAGTYICMAQNSIGSAQVQVEVSVEAAHGKPGAPEITVKPTLTVIAGETATLQCSATGDPPPTIQWSKLRAPLPWQHQVVNNTLLIRRVAQQDSGQYICNASNAAGFTEAFITLDVETPPYATSLPEEVSVQAGEAVQLQCLAHGTPPLHYQWSKANGSLSSHAVLRASALHISPIAHEDSGTYRCRVSNRVGSAEAFAQVSVQAGTSVPLSPAGSAPGASPTVRVTPQMDVKGVGGTAEFTCSVTGDTRARIEWVREGGELPASHSVRNGVLRIQNLDRGCQGVYTCRVSSPSGQAQDSARLVIQALPKVMINVRTSVQSVLVGAAVEFECLAIGDPKARITWSKVGSHIRPEVVVSGGTVKIERVEQSDAGQYRCTATNDVGTVQSNVILHVQSIPQIATQPEVKEVTTGSRAVFPCLASGFPVPEIKWTKLEGDLPKDICLENNILTIPSVKPEDAGIYVCTASNRQGKVTAFSMLKVRERVVPYFTQNPPTFLALPTIKDAYKKFEIQITFRPESADGMLLYNGQKKSTGADFVSFGLVGGRPEFRFDAGSGMATIRHPAPIRLGEFHTIRLHRNLTRGSLVLDSHPPVNGTSQGKFQGLDLNEELYLGGYPDYTAVAKSGLSSGFVGCVRQLLVQGEEVIFKDLDLRAHSVSNCPTCRDRPCQNGGVCRDSESSSYVCHCPQEFTGSNCEHSQALHCHPGTAPQHRCPIATALSHGTRRGPAGQPWARPCTEWLLSSLDPISCVLYPALNGPSGAAQAPEPLAKPREAPGTEAEGACVPVTRRRLSPRQVSINGKKVDISYSFLESRGIAQCYDNSPCDRGPCLHGATCMATGEYAFQCRCQDGFRGDRCELAEDRCLLRNPCLNGGTCKANQCLCPAGFSGPYCEQGTRTGAGGSRPADAPGQYGAYFQDGGYLALPRHVLPPVGANTSRSPHRYQLGSGEASIVSEDPINDGEWHRVTAIREGRQGSIQVDGEELVSGESPGSNVMVNTQGSVYIGGAPAIRALTAGKFRSGITGCIKNLVLSSERPGPLPRQPIDLQHHSEAGVNMQECPS